MLRKWVIGSLGVFVLTACAGTPQYKPVESEEPVFSQEQVLADLEEYLAFIETTHPDPSYTINEDDLTAAVGEIRRRINEAMTTRQVWSELALLNAHFHDAHMGIRIPVAQFETYKAQGGIGFPIPLEATNNELHVGAVAEGSNVSQGEEILSINGIRTKQILDDIRPRLRGESQSLRNFVLSLRFDSAFWATYGGFDAYQVEVRGQDGRRRRELLTTASARQTDSVVDVAKFFRFKTIEGNVGVLEIDSFEISLRDAFISFLSETFTEIQSASIETLIIDIRNNGGGARDLSDPLLSYLTGERYTPTSKITARVTEQNVGRLPGAKLGSIITVPFPQWVTPGENPLRFEGDVYVLISERSYSQAIVFANIVQDFGIGKLVGEETSGRASQTGQVQKITLANTKVEGAAPIYIFYRAKPGDVNKGVVPDIAIAHDPQDRGAIVHDLLEQIASE